MRPSTPILYIFSGLPGTGKTTIAQRLSKHLNAVNLRIDTVEQGLRDLCDVKVEGEGYRLSYRIAADNLCLGLGVVSDSCNPIDLTRDEWEEVATSSNAKFINIEISCSDKAEHRKRVDSRQPTVPGLVLPTWEEVETREYHAWKKSVIRIDTAAKTIDDSFDELITEIDNWLR